MELENQVVIITGGGKGIGQRIAKKFYQEGARLAVWDVERGDCDSLCDYLFPMVYFDLAPVL